jgi:hypothetical protein
VDLNFQCLGDMTRDLNTFYCLYLGYQKSSGMSQGTWAKIISFFSA